MQFDALIRQIVQKGRNMFTIASKRESVHTGTNPEVANILFWDKKPWDRIGSQGNVCTICNCRVLQKRDVGLFTGCDDVFGPNGAVHFSDMGLSEEEHADTGLTDTAADGEGERLVQNGLLEGEVRSLGAARLDKLLAERLCVDADAHGGELQRDVEETRMSALSAQSS